MNDFDKLKDLLFGAEKEALDSISERVEHPETRTVDVADVLAEAIHQSHKENSDLVDSLTAPVGECLQQALREDPQTYSDALYPVMGPAIRKSIAHTLKEFSQQINQAVEHSLTPKGLKWRLQASRAGIPFGDFVMQRTLLYRVEQAYLISRENGLLIEHVHHSASKINDSDAVSAMFTAIQDFVKESFSPDRTGRLESADMGDFTLWAVHGPHAMLVCVIRGVPPKKLRSELSAVLERIHFRYGDAVKDYAGNTDSVPGVDGELQKCLEFQAAQDVADSKRGPPWPLIIVGAVILSLFAYLWFSQWAESNELKKLTDALNETPGLYLASASRDGDQIRVHGMRDPLSLSVLDVAENNGISAASIVADMKPFQSLEREIIERRVEQAMGDLDTVDFDLVGTAVTVTGEATRTWIEEARARVNRIAGVEAVDFSAVTDSDLRRIRIDSESLSGTRFLFSSGTTFDSNQGSMLREHAKKLSDLKSQALLSGRILRVTLIGSTDTVGDAEANTRLALRRAEATAAILLEFGISAHQLKQTAVDPDETSSDDGPGRRNVSIELSLAQLDDRS